MKFLYNKFVSKELFWYGVFGILTTIINFVTYYVCNIIIKINVGISTTIAFIISVIFAYITNKKYVFKSNNNALKEFFSFCLSRIFSYFIDLIFMILLVDIYNFNSSISKLIVNILVIIINYIFSKFFIFKDR